MSEIIKTKARDAYFDNLRLVLMFCVVLCHCLEKLRGTSPMIAVIHELMLAFVMPLFVFTTGFFAKGMANGASPKRTRIVNIALLYIIAQLIKMAIAGKSSMLQPRYANWFLICMIAWYIILPLAARFKPAAVLSVSVFAALMIGLDPKADAVLHISRVICFFPFFMMGFYVNKVQIAYIRKPNARRFGACVLVLIIIFYVFFWRNCIPVSMLHAATPYAKMKISNWEGCSMRLVWFAVAGLWGYGVMSIIPEKQTKLTVLGTRTLPIYIIHTCLYQYFIVIDFFDIFKNIPNEYLRLGSALLLSIAVTLVCGNRFFAKVFDQIMGYDFKPFLKKESDAD